MDHEEWLSSLESEGRTVTGWEEFFPSQRTPIKHDGEVVGAVLSDWSDVPLVFDGLAYPPRMIVSLVETEARPAVNYSVGGRARSASSLMASRRGTRRGSVPGLQTVQCCRMRMMIACSSPAVSSWASPWVAVSLSARARRSAAPRSENSTSRIAFSTGSLSRLLIVGLSCGFIGRRPQGVCHASTTCPSRSMYATSGLMRSPSTCTASRWVIAPSSSRSARTSQQPRDPMARH